MPLSVSPPQRLKLGIFNAEAVSRGGAAELANFKFSYFSEEPVSVAEIVGTFELPVFEMLANYLK